MNIRLLLCFALIASFTVSCVKTVDPTPDVVFKCKIDDEDASFPASAAVLLQTEMEEFISLTITATTVNLDPSNFTMIVLNEFAVGTYDVTTNNLTAGYVSNSISDAKSYDAISGSLTISEIDTESGKLKGSFSMVMEFFDDNTIKLDVTEGEFDIPYTQ